MSLALISRAAAEDAILPDGKGREAVESACTACHSAERIMKQSMTVDQWRSEVRTMVENGASLSADEWEPVVAYLVKNFGPKINVNKGTAKEMATALQLTTEEADAIVAFRKTNGDFKQIRDLAKVPGLDTKKIAAKETRIEF